MYDSYSTSYFRLWWFYPLMHISLKIDLPNLFPLPIIHVSKALFFLQKTSTTNSSLNIDFPLHFYSLIVQTCLITLLSYNHKLLIYWLIHGIFPHHVFCFLLPIVHIAVKVLYVKDKSDQTLVLLKFFMDSFNYLDQYLDLMDQLTGHGPTILCYIWTHKLTEEQTYHF